MKDLIEKNTINHELGKTSFPLSWKIERKIINLVLPHIPSWLNGTNLTISSLFWSFFIVVLIFWAPTKNIWCLLFTILILLQYITDSFDGAIGRFRNSGRNAWGYVMDHSLDVIFLNCVVLAYYFFIPDLHIHFLILLVLLNIVFSILFLSAQQAKLQMSYLKIGPTELRFLAIIFNILIITNNLTALQWLVSLVIVVGFISVIFFIYQIQKEADHKDKQQVLL